jgi:fluoride ion exporter CrcB/FEX
MTVLFCLAAGLGAVLRYVADYYLPRHGILLVNILGSLLAGVTLGHATMLGFQNVLTQVILGGFAGSMTTYASVAVTAAQQRTHRTRGAVKTWTLHVGLSLAACLCGFAASIVLAG